MIFIVLEAVIYITFIVFDLTDVSPSASDLIKYLGVLTALIHAFLMYLRLSGRDRLLTLCALFFTAVADIFLLFFPENYIPGIASFCITQTLYMLMTTKKGDRKTRLFLPVSIGVISLCAAVFAASFIPGPDTLLLIAVLPYYALMFIANTVRSWVIFRRTGNAYDLTFAIGLSLFILCDINVLIRNLNGFFPGLVSQGVFSASIFMTWIFYLPSQTLISYRTKLKVPSSHLCLR
ncbi:MAG: lysoplasmalogenase [Lachnospiraceae bacterium]|nr:lysoplasmalogenase [Lachnospiraceae bacterium]